MNNQIEILRHYIESDPAPDYTDYLLFEYHHQDEDEKIVGVLYCDPSADDLDDHCDRCRDEILPLCLRGVSEALPKYLVVNVGERKFARIKEGWRDSSGLDLREVKFV